MRNISQLHPEAQKKALKLQQECLKVGIKIKIGECFRTVDEQDALYAIGRKAGGSIVTNAKGNSFSSMHQWGVAFDIYLDMDIDGDGKTSDDIYNNTKKTFNKVGAIGKDLGLEWGGDWKSIKDLPHFQLPYWGSTTSKLKSVFGTPKKFIDTWGNNKVEGVKPVKNNETTAAKNTAESAKSKDSKYSKTYTVTASCLNLRSGAGTKKLIINVIPKGKEVTCYGFYTAVGDDIWLYVRYGKYVGYVNKKYLK